MYSPLIYSDALFLATKGGAQLLDLKDSLGSLQTGYQADILLVDMAGRILYNVFII